ncbi:hypothetical protein Tco_0967436 [Tanacetum coccineum]
MQKESVSKQGRKPAKSEPTVHKDPAFDDLDDVDVNDVMDYMETDDYIQKGVSTEDQVSTVKPNEGTDKSKVSTDKPEVSTAKPKEVEVSTDKLDEGTAEPKDGTSNERNEDGLTLQSIYDLCVSLCKQVIDQAKEIKHLMAQIKKLKKKAKPFITHHQAWMKSVSMKQRLAGKKSLKTKWMQKESVSTQGSKPAKAEPIVHKDPAFDDLDDIMDDAMDYMESKDAQDEGRTSSVVLEEKESTQKGVTTEVEISTVKPDEGTDKSKVSTDKPEVSTAKTKEVEVSTDKLNEGTAEPKDGTSDESTAPTTFFRDDETIAEFLVSMSQNKAKQKGVEIKDTEDSDRPRATSTRLVLTLKPLPKIDPKDKGKKVLEEEAESDAESEGVDEVERKFDQLAKDEEISRKDRIEADRLLVARLQEEERETFTVEEITPEEWEVFRWRLYEACGVCILELKDGTVIHMLVERRYPLSKKLLQRMLDLGLEVEEESVVALHLVRFIKQQLNEE